ncbi:MAG: hypothetical protein K8I30_20990 [Anaerolineae bacterium]|nr:hypothetical protein [Anaerolineae bacterium]
MQANLRRRAIILGTIVMLLILLVLLLRFLLISDPFPMPISPFELTATAIREHNATIEGFVQQTQAALTQTPAQ